MSLGDNSCWQKHDLQHKFHLTDFSIEKNTMTSCSTLGGIYFFKWYTWTYSYKKKNRVTDAENKLMVSKVKGWGGINWEIVCVVVVCVCVCVCTCLLSHVWLFVTSWIIANQAHLSLEFFRQEYLNGLPLPSSYIRTAAAAAAKSL